jgi:pyridoxamine 5'-phosphate oxidase family protein
MSFDEDEKAYLRSQRLARFATVSGDGQPDVTPVGFEFDGSDFYLGGLDLRSTRKYRNVTAGHDQVALVVDDVVTSTPWTPRFVRVYGTARPVRRDGPSGSGEYLQMTPTVSWSWNLEGRPFSGGGEQFRPRKTIHGTAKPEALHATTRPWVSVVSQDAQAAVDAFAAGLQAGHDQRDADVLNRQFAADVVWGSPYGALVQGFDQLHPIHVRFQQGAREKPEFRYEVRHVLAVSEDVVVAHIARLALDADNEPLPPGPDRGGPFSELAMYVLVHRDGQWWLAAGQNTPMRPGGAVPAAPFPPPLDAAK